MSCADCGMSINEIRNHVLLRSNIDDILKYDEKIVNWTFDCERLIGTYNGLKINNNVKLTPQGKKIPLPDDLAILEDACFGNNASYYTGVGRAYNNTCGCGNNSSCSCIKWYENDCYIFTSREVDACTISYLSIPIDEDGFPYVRASHLDAIVAYIKFALLEGRFDDGKVPQFVYNERRMQMLQKIRAARAADGVPNDKEMERLSNIWNSKLPVSYRAVSGFYGVNFPLTN